MTYYLKKYWKVNTAAAVFQIGRFGCTAAWNLLMMQSFQAIIDLDLKRFLFWIGVAISLSATRNFLTSVENVFQSRAIRLMNNQLRKDMSYSLLQKTHQDFHSRESGEYLSQFTNDIQQIEQYAWRPFFDVVGLIANVTFSMIALVSLHWSLLFTALFTAFAIIMVPNLFSKRMERMGAVCAREQASAVSKLKDLLAGFDVLNFFGRGSRLLEGTEAASEQIEAPRYRQSVIQTNIGSGLDFFAYLLQEVNLVLIGYLSIRGIIIQSALSGGGNLCGAVYNGLKQISTSRLSFAASKPYFDKITDHAPEGEMEQAPAMEPLRESITVENLSFRYDKKPILEQASFRFEKGGKYALTGPSGCGKSTLLKLLLGWLPEYTGQIFFDKTDIRTIQPSQLQQQLSYIEQNVFLFNTTIRDNITLGEAFTQEQLNRAIRDSALAGDLAIMPDGLDTLVGEEGSSLSGGQKQRVAIARALIHNRSILLVDEGTSALDAANADIVEQSLLANPELTLILISHHLTEQRKAQFDRVYELVPAI